MTRHAVDWARIRADLDRYCHLRRMTLRQVAEQTGISASGLTKLRQGDGHLSADKLAALVAWLWPNRTPRWIVPVDDGPPATEDH